MTTFSDPASGEKLDLPALNGALLIIEPAEVVLGMATSFGPSDAIRATVHVVDGPNAGDINVDALIFPKVLQGALRNRIGEKVLGRLGQGVAKPGQSAPWTLTAGTAADIAAAEAFLAARPAAPALADPDDLI